jgi:hypothetical protein
LRAVSRVGVDGKLDPREVLADALNGKQIFARLDFDFDALVAGG